METLASPDSILGLPVLVTHTISICGCLSLIESKLKPGLSTLSLKTKFEHNRLSFYIWCSFNFENLLLIV